MKDYGLQLDCVSDETSCTEQEIVDAVNAAVAKFGYKIRQHAEWPIFRKGCVEEERFVNGLRTSEIQQSQHPDCPPHPSDRGQG